MSIFLCFVSTSWCAIIISQNVVAIFSFKFNSFCSCSSCSSCSSSFFSNKLEELNSQFGSESKNINIISLLCHCVPPQRKRLSSNQQKGNNTLKQEGHDQLCLLGTRKANIQEIKQWRRKTNYITVNYETKRKQHTRKIKLGKVRAVKLAVSSD